MTTDQIAAERSRRRKYYERHKDRIIAKSRQYYDTNKAEILAKQRANRKKRPSPWADPVYRQRMSEAHKGKPGYWTAKKLSKDHRDKLSASHKANPQKYWLGKKCPHFAGENNPGYIDGRNPINRKDRHGMEYERWRREVFRRDDYTCQECGVRGGVLHADHIKPFAVFPALRFDLGNGRTLCKSCHLKTPTWGRKALSYDR